MPQSIVQVDAFTDQPFRGNPAGVCLLPGPADRDWMQAVAREMNLSETAFLYDVGDCYHLQWFTPVTEVELCGHATLASAHVLWQDGNVKPDAPIAFRTRSGILTARQGDGWIEMDFPATPEEYCVAPIEFTEAFGVALQYVGFNGSDYLIEVDSEDTVRNIAPDCGILASISARGFIVTSIAENRDYDFVSRFFAPGAGIPEDPVTGSAHCCLAPFWSTRLARDTLTGYQASARGGIVRTRVQGDRVMLGGQAVTVMHGTLA
ncbi:MAG: PhzF family phenazine biosynthesis protein [Gemmatimonadales bacterium]